jgi:hypothetical protein
MIRNPGRASDEHGREIEPMTLGTMREHGAVAMPSGRFGQNGISDSMLGL